VTVARYDDVADFYSSGWLDVYDDAVSLALFDLLDPVNDLSVLDLACGHGRISRELARRGGRVVGVDLSEKLIDKARAIDANEPLGISYIKADAASPSILPGQAFGAVVSSFGLSDIDDLDGALATVARVLLPMGRFVFSMLHPCFAGGKDVSGSWPSTGSYYDDGWWAADAALSSLRRQVGANHRALSTYVNMLRSHSLGIDAMAEPPPPSEWSAQRPDAARLPVFLVARAARR
jgi:ubiquinone/menaquinone biosynthesis C-methylase UbiE